MGPERIGIFSEIMAEDIKRTDAKTERPGRILVGERPSMK
jgi:hypothetical protein